MYGTWELRYDDTILKFGTPAYPVQVKTFVFAADKSDDEDEDIEYADGRRFGRDFLRAGELRINLKIDFTTYPAGPEECARLAWEARQAFDRAWRADPVRHTSGVVAELVMGGEVAVEGRPRPIAWDDDAQNRGFITGAAIFVPSGRMYDANADWQSVTAQLVPPEEKSGWIHPLIFPLGGTVPASRAATFTVGGTGDAEPIVEVYGPIQAGAYVEVPGCFKITVNRALAYDQVAKVDAREGIRVQTINDAPRMFFAASSTRMSEMRVPPGDHQVIFRGSSLEGTARVVVSWRDVRAGL